MVEALFIGQKVRLAAPRNEDTDLVWEWQHDSQYRRNMDDDPIRFNTREELAKWLVPSDTHYHFHIRTLDTDQFVGFVSLMNIQWRNRDCTVGIGIGAAENRGKGYGTDAMRLALRFAFDEMVLHRVSLTVIADNEAARHVYEKVGFRREGVKRGALLRSGQRTDVLYYGILIDEWQALMSVRQSE